MANNFDGLAFHSSPNRGFSSNVGNSASSPLSEFSLRGASANVPTVNQVDTSSFLDGLAGDSSGLGSLGNIATGISGLASAFAGLKQLGLAEDAFKFNKSAKEKELAMAQDAYDKNVARAKSVGDQMRAGKVN